MTSYEYSYAADVTERAAKTSVQVGVATVIANIAVTYLSRRFPEVAEASTEVHFAIVTIIATVLSVFSSWVSRKLGGYTASVLK